MVRERIDGDTPNGGAYCEIFYLDSKNNFVDSSAATKCIIRECDADGNLIVETYGICSPNSNQTAPK